MIETLDEASLYRAIDGLLAAGVDSVAVRTTVASGGNGALQATRVAEKVSLDATSLESLAARFETEYHRLFGHVVPGTSIEIMNRSVTVSNISPPVAEAREPDPVRQPPLTGRRELYLGRAERRPPVSVYRRAELEPGDRFDSIPTQEESS
jgi:N-methylhydantoinase A/oxoprolinase/acetone carboxylase beta subunit